MNSHAQLLHEDAASRERALELESFIVEAPAGAGKTELLTQRYLRLLQTVQDPEEIVAITFTNKAAAEMRLRILESLKVAAEGVPPPQAHKQRTFELATAALAASLRHGWNLMEQPGRLRINTIDSLCSHLARQMPLLSRFGTQPGISLDAASHYDEAVRRTLALLEDGGEAAAVVAKALRHLDNDHGRLTRLLAAMLARRDQWLQHTHRHSAQDEAEAALRQLVENELCTVIEVLPGRLQASLMPVARYAASNLPCDHAIALLLDWAAGLDARPETLPMWRGVCDLLLTGTGTLRSRLDKGMGLPATEEARPFKEALGELIETLRQTPGAEATMARIRRLPQPRHGDAEWEIVGVFAQLLNLAAAQLWVVFQEAGEVDFVEIARRALEALGEEDAPTDLALKLDYRISHLLVDEFQDTSPAQIDLLRRLTRGWTPDDGRTLFCVGDPMQSIYRFRKAEVGLFLRVAEAGIDNLPMTRLRLCRNNRSCPEVVDWINDAFADVFPTQDGVTQGAIRYRPFVATRDSLPQAGVTVHAMVLPRDTAAEDMHAGEARRIVGIILDERRDDPTRKIAVLVRARSHLEALVAEIRRHHPGLPFQAVEIEALAGRQIVQDLLALTHALHHRADRVHWLAILRAPWCGMTLADLHALAADDHRATLWTLMNDEMCVQRLSEDGRERLLHVRGVLAEALAHRGRQPLRRWVEGVWLQLGGAACLWAPGDVRDVQAYLDLIERLERGGQLSMEALAAEVDKLYAAPDARADDTLQFMTIHKSKGLEFDTVILPGLHRGGGNDDKPLLLWEEVPLDGVKTRFVAAPLMPRNDGQAAAYDYLQLLERERADNEDARVLYVGVTRAVRALHLVGVIRNDPGGNAPKAPANTPLDLLWHRVGADFGDDAARCPNTAGETPSPFEPMEDFIPPLVRLRQPAIPGLLRASAGFVPPLFEQPAEGEQSGTRLDADVGTLAHRYVEIIAQHGLESWTPRRLNALQPAMQRWLTQHGHAGEDARRGAARVTAALLATLSSEAGRWVLQAREGAAAELALATAEGGRIATHVIDRTFVEHGERWIVDYKSARLGEVSEASMAQQAERYRPQLERYARLFGHEGLPVRKAVFFLAHGRMVELE